MATLERAVEIAVAAHAGQKDRVGKPYVEHPLRVMAAGRTTEEKIVGVLHDVVEDSEWTFEQLVAEGFSPKIIDALRCLTKGDDEPYDRYISRVKTNELDFYNKPERYRILVSDTDDSFDSFTVIGGDREAAADEWEEVNVDISEYDNKPVYIALQYISINNEGVVMMVDDVEVITNLQGTSISSAYNSADDITISSERNGISINAGEEIIHVYVYSPSGQMVYDYAPGARSHAIPSSALQAGLYIVKAETANGSKTAKVKM